MAVVKLRLDAQNAQLSFLIRNVVRLSPNFHGSHGEMLATPPIFLFSFGHETKSTGNENAKRTQASAKGRKTQRSCSSTKKNNMIV